MTQVNEILNSSSKIPTIFIINYFFQGFFKNLSKERTPSELLLKKFTNIRRTFLLLTSVVAPILLDLLSLPLTVKLSKPNKTIELRRRNEQKKGVSDITFWLHLLYPGHFMLPPFQLWEVLFERPLKEICLR